MVEEGAARSPYDVGLKRTAANYQPLSPLSLVKRAAYVYPEYTSIVHSDVRYTWRETYTRCRRLASALRSAGIRRNDTVSILASNIPAMCEAHFGIPMAGAVLNTINTRLDAAGVAFILDHSEAKLLFVSDDYSELVGHALAIAVNKPRVITIAEEGSGEGSEYEEFLASGDPDCVVLGPTDELEPIALSYTSGTTGNPKGVVTHHRGAYLAALGNALSFDLKKHTAYLWTLPMFHCNGWSFPWTLAAVAGTNVCLRKVTAKGIYDAITTNHVDLFCGAPTVLTFILNADLAERRELTKRVTVFTGGAAPPAAVLDGMRRNGFDLIHGYGLTEVYGPSVFCAWKEAWSDLPYDQQAVLASRQGVPIVTSEDAVVMDPISMKRVPADGKTVGEVMIRGNLVMKGYFKNPAATDEAFSDGWFHTGDLGVTHPDGYLQVKDRSKDIIISGGENISSLEVEEVLYRHPAVMEAAVVAKEDDVWGETPCAFVTLRATAVGSVSTDDIIEFCRDNLAHFKAPKMIVFDSLPKNATGKILKNELRERASKLGLPERPKKSAVR